jgi:hypothetical protein
MLGVNFAGGNGAVVSGTERFSLPATGQRDLAANYHDARIPLMCALGVHHPCLEPTVEDLVTLASQIGFEFARFMTSPPAKQVRTKRPDTPATFGCPAQRRQRIGADLPIS